jgi:hypothetical protein
MSATNVGPCAQKVRYINTPKLVYNLIFYISELKRSSKNAPQLADDGQRFGEVRHNAPPPRRLC